MKELKVIFATLCMICAHAMAQDIPLSGIDPPEGASYKTNDRSDSKS